MRLLKQLEELEEDQRIGVEKRIKISAWIFGSSLVVWLLSNTAWIFLGTPTYYIGIASMIFGSCFSVYLINILPRWITTIGVLISLNNLMDELFFDPTEINFNEYLVFGTAIIFICIKRNKLKKQINNKQKDERDI